LRADRAVRSRCRRAGRAEAAHAGRGPGRTDVCRRRRTRHGRGARRGSSRRRL